MGALTGRLRLPQGYFLFPGPHLEAALAEGLNGGSPASAAGPFLGWVVSPFKGVGCPWGYRLAPAPLG